jgi:hypothetical protein
MNVDHTDVLGPALILSVHRFVRTIDLNLHLSRVVEDCATGYATAMDALVVDKLRAWAELETIRREIGTLYPALETAAPDCVSDLAGRPFDEFDDGLKRLRDDPKGSTRARPRIHTPAPSSLPISFLSSFRRRCPSSYRPPSRPT